jgi:threonylcarbamoyladenosine tRNA methylthiotransferase CDKAL1
MKKTKVYIKTYGCTLNQSDSERIKGILNTDKDIEIVDSLDKCDIEIINSCTVKNTAEEKLFREIRNAEAKGKKVVVAGCVPQAEKSLIKNKLKNYSIIGPNNIHDVKSIIKNKGIFLENIHPIKKINIQTLPNNKFVTIIPISEGCIGSCSYCKTKQARGELSSYPEKDIIAIAKKAIENGAKELWLTAQDTSCYGFDIRSKDGFTHKTNLAKLVKKIIKIKGDFKVRVGMGNPNSFLEIIDEYLPLFESDKMYKFFHIPIQSGSDKVLKDMNRFYSVKDFKKLIKIIRKKIKNVFIATDIIVGYPVEDEKDFQKSLALIKWLRPEMLNISRMWLRQGTPAQRKHKQLPTKLVKERSQEVTKLFHEILEKNKKKWKNWSGKIIITEKGKNNSWIGKNEFYKQVIIKGDNIKIGDVIKCKTQSLGRFEIVAELV